jgi:hypothetical protein
MTMQVFHLYGKYWIGEPHNQKEAGTLDTNHGEGSGLQYLEREAAGGRFTSGQVFGEYATAAEAQLALVDLLEENK